MFESSPLVSAIIQNVQRTEAEADRRAFYGPDAPPVPEPRRKNRGPRLFRRNTGAN
jgi:hypothetical protein